MKNVVIVDSVRTGLAKSHRGGFNMTRPDEMLAHLINALLERNSFVKSCCTMAGKWIVRTLIIITFSQAEAQT